MTGDPIIADPIIAELINHLWQSTVFAAAAGLLTVALRKNGAHVRYWLWLTASVKFLVPFSLLVSLGSQLQWAPAAKNIATQAVSYTMVQITQPFPDSVPLTPSAPRGTDWFPIVFFGVWMCGFGVIALMRLRDGMRIRAAMRASTPLDVPALVRAGVEVRSYPGLLEPGVVGLLRPMLLLPAGIVDRLTRPQVEAIFAHELCHVRRRDNLTAALHMAVETVFWFHPLVWWIGARLVEERERACDEEVLRLGGEPQIYAEAILNVCKFYVESPLACMSGVTGSDLKKRIERIMKDRFAAALSARKKLLLVAAGVAALVLPVAAGVLTAPRLGAQSSAGQFPAADANQPAFDVVSIKPNTTGSEICTRVAFSCWMDLGKPGILTGVNQSLRDLVVAAYALTPAQARMISGAPKWMDSERFDIQATAGGNPGKEQKRMMLQSLLADRFKFALHHEKRQGPIYALVQAKAGKTGPGLTQHSNVTACIDPNAPRPPKLGDSFCGGFLGLNRGGLTHLTGNNTTMVALAEQLGDGMSGDLDRTVVDRTGLNGTFDVTLEYTPRSQIDSGASDPAAPPSLITALQEQLGLRLVPQTGPVDVLVIDHVEQPSDNSAQAPATQPPGAPADRLTFEAASVKPLTQADPNPRFGFQPGGRFVSTVAVQYAISFAYNLPMNPSPRLTGGPDWIRSMDAAYDIEATGVFPAGLSEKAYRDRQRLMLQALLAERFKLVIHRETKELPVYALVVAKGGPKLQKADVEEKNCPDRSATPPPDPKTLCHDLGGGRGRGIHARAASMSDLASGVENWADRPLVDKTGIQGLYHIETTGWLPMQVGPPPAPGAKAEDGSYQSDLPTIFEVFEKLGLRMEARKDKVDVYVIDRIERPSAN